MKLVRQEVGGVILSTSQQAHVNLQLVMFLGMHLESVTKQWGFSKTKSTVTFPLTFNSFVKVLTTYNDPNAGFTSYPFSATGVTLANFYIRSESNPSSEGCIAWCAIGS